MMSRLRGKESLGVSVLEIHAQYVAKGLKKDWFTIEVNTGPSPETRYC